MTPRHVAQALGWFGIGLGAVEFLAPAIVARAVGLPDREGTIRLFGLREIASGIVILAASEPERLLWTRVLGDGLDAALLASAMRPSNPGKLRAMAAMAAVTPVVLLDALSAFRR